MDLVKINFGKHRGEEGGSGTGTVVLQILHEMMNEDKMMTFRKFVVVDERNLVILRRIG